jgi:small subunit ribosomal protein S21
MERSGGASDVRIPQLPTTRVTEILIRDGDSFEIALKKFGRKVLQSGVLSEARRRQHYEPPSVKRKRKAVARRRKERKAQAKAAARGY